MALLASLKVNFAKLADTPELKHIKMLVLIEDYAEYVDNDIFYLVALINQASFRLVNYVTNNITTIDIRDLSSMLFLKNNLLTV